jgi:hypothetical protein
MTEEETLELIRRELLKIFEEANDRSREGKGGFGTSTTDMVTGKGTPTEYLVQVVQERLASQSKTSDKKTKETGAKDRAVSRWENEGGAMRQPQRAAKKGRKK